MEEEEKKFLTKEEKIEKLDRIIKLYEEGLKNGREYGSNDAFLPVEELRELKCLVYGIFKKFYVPLEEVKTKRNELRPEKKYTPFLNKLSLIHLDTKLGKEVFEVVANYMRNKLDELEEKYNGSVGTIKHEWSRYLDLAIDEGLKKIDETIKKCEIKDQIDFIKSFTDYKDKIENTKNTIRRIIEDSVLYYNYTIIKIDNSGEIIINNFRER